MDSMPTREQIQDALRKVIDPELRKDIVSLGMVRSIETPEEGRVDVIVSLTTPGCPIRSHFEKAVKDSVGELGVSLVNVGFDVLSADEKQTLSQRLGRQGGLPEGALAAVKNVICIGSGKGGVGKSTVTANLAAALQAEGKDAAVLDADVWGYSIPRMLGVHGRPMVSAQRKILPLDAHGGVRVISIEFFLNEQDQAITWRGPMLHKAIRQFLEDVDWGELDYLLIDLPPGTGDVSMTLAQLLP
jgi:ATP-binding protein involved in chromosome partitioning